MNIEVGDNLISRNTGEMATVVEITANEVKYRYAKYKRKRNAISHRALSSYFFKIDWETRSLVTAS